MEQQLTGFLSSLKGHQLTSGYLIQGFKKIILSHDISEQLVGFMNNQLFVSNRNIFYFFDSAVKASTKQLQDVKTDYVKMRGDRLLDYVHILVGKFKEYYSVEQNDKQKLCVLRVLGKIFKHIKHTQVMEESVKPEQFAEFLIRQLKMFKLTPTLRGQLWYLTSLVYKMFPRAMTNDTKKQIQQTMLKQLESAVNSDKNLATIARLVKSISETVCDNFLNSVLLNKYFNYITVLSIPLKSTYDVPKNALKALTQNASFFHNNIMSKAKQVFQNLLQLMSHHNKELKNKAGQALEAVNIQIVKGMYNNPGKYQQLYTQMISRLWEIIKQKSPNQSPQQQKSQSQAGKMATVLKVVGDLAPTIVKLSGPDQLQLMFSNLIEILDARTLKSFYITQTQMSQAIKSKFSKASSFVYLLYNQKLICSYLSAFGKIIPYLTTLNYNHIQLLQKVWILSIKQYPYYYQKYVPLLFLSMTQFLSGFSTRTDIFQKWLKKMILRSLKQTLDLNRFTIGSSDNYYNMIKKSFEIWNGLLNQTIWSGTDAQELFKDTLFQSFQYQLKTLDISYKKPSQDDEQISNEIVSIFTGLGKLFEASNISQYQYMYSLTLVFQHLLLKIDPQFYQSRLYQFYMDILRRFKHFPKSIPLMKLSRSLNDYMYRTNYLTNLPDIQKKQLIHSIDDIVTQIFDQLLVFENIFLYDGLKMLMSIPMEIVTNNRFRILKTQLPVVIRKALDLGHQAHSLAYIAIKCLQRLFLSKSKKQVKKYLSSLIPDLQKYLSYKKNEQVVEKDPNLSLWELDITKVLMMDECLLFLGKLGGDAHHVVPKFRSEQSRQRLKNDGLNMNQKNIQNSYINWDYEASLYFPMSMSNFKIDINITKILPRLCHLMTSSPLQNTKVTASELMHAIVIFMIGKSASNPKRHLSEIQQVQQNSFKKTASKIYEKILPYIFKVSCNIEHPSNELMRTLSIQLVRFLSNTQQPDSPDLLVLISLLVQLLSCSQDLSDFASKCLVELIKYNLKQNPNKQYPLFKMLMRNIWPLALSKKPGAITLITQILRVVHKQDDIMIRYLLEFFSLVLTLSKTNNPLPTQFKYLLNKLILSLRNYVTLLKVNEKQSSKFKNINELLSYLYTSGFTSLFSQQREVSFYIWQQILLKYGDQLNMTIQNFLFVRAVESKMLFGGNLSNIQFLTLQQDQVQKLCSKLDAQTQLWSRMTQNQHFVSDKIVLFKDFSLIYLPSLKRFYQFLFQEQFIKASINLSTKTTDCVLFSFIKSINLLNILLQHSSDQYTVPSIITQTIQQNFLLKTISTMFLRPQLILDRINYDMFLTQFKDSFKYLGKIFKTLASSDYFLQFKNVIQQLFSYSTSKSLILTLLQSQVLYDIQLQVYLLGQAEINEALVASHMNTIGGKWVDLQLKRLIDIILKFNEPNDQLKISKHKMKSLVHFALSHQNQRVFPFATRQLINNTRLFQTFQKQFISFICTQWDKIGSEITAVSLESLHVAKILFGLIKYLNVKQCNRMAVWLTNLKIPRTNPQILEQELKINFFLIEQINITPDYLQYQNFILRTAMDDKQPLRVHQAALNIIGLLIHFKQWKEQNMNLIKSYILNILPIYIPSIGSTLKQQNRQKYTGFLKVIKSFLILSGTIQLFQPLISIFIETPKQSIKQLTDNIIEQFITNCFLNKDPLVQTNQMRFVLNHFLDPNFDKQVEKNKRIGIAQMFIKRMLNVMTSIELILSLFDQYIHSLNLILKIQQGLPHHQLLLRIQLKSAAFRIIECFYKIFPPKRTHEQVHRKQYHKTLIIESNETLKNQFKHQSLIREIQQSKKYHFSVIEIMYDLWHSAYNLLIVLFICTQKNKDHFKTYLFDKKQGRFNILWQHILDATKIDLCFEITTDFKIMKPIQRVCKPLKSKIKSRYMSSSLFIIDEQLIPKSQLQDAVLIDQIPLAEIERQNQSKINEIPLELDVINKHPCMHNILMLIDFMHSFFNQSGTPAWMTSIYQELSNSQTPLMVQVFFIKLIINRPNVFNQDIWLPILIKYLGQAQNGSKFFHYFYRDAAKQAIAYIQMGYPIQGKPVCQAINKMLAMLPHPENPYLFSDNITIIQKFLEQRKVFVEERILNKIINFEEGKQNYLQWRTTGVIVLKICLMEKVPILSSYQQLLSLESSPQRFRYIHKLLQTDLRSITKLFSQSKQKYSIAAAGLVGQILKSLNDIGLQRHSISLKENITVQLSNLAIGKNRIQRERFCLIINQVTQIYPQTMEISKINSYSEDALFSSNPRDRIYILDCYKIYFEYQIKNNYQFVQIFEGFCMTVKGCIDRIALDGPDVHTAFLEALSPLIIPQFLSQFLLFDLIYSMFPVLQKIYHKFTDPVVLYSYYNMIITIDRFLDNQTDNRFSANEKVFKTYTKNSLIRGLSSPIQQVRKKIITHLQQFRDKHPIPSQRLLYMLNQFFIPQSEQLWLITAVPLILSLTKQTSDYERLLFEQSLDNLAVYYDWDFRKGFKNHISQPYTPAYTLNTQFIKKQAMNSIAASQYQITNLEGLIKASQSFQGGGQSQPIFTQLDMPNSFGSVQGSQGSSQIQGSQPQVHNIFRRQKRKSPAQIVRFMASNALVYNKFSVVSGNRFRFGKPDQTKQDKQRQYQKQAEAFLQRVNKQKQKSTLLRKYKIGQLPDIQIKSRDLVDPLIQLAFYDEEFASQLLSVLFEQMCKRQKSSNVFVQRFKEAIPKAILNSQKYTFMFISTMQQLLTILCKQTGKYLHFDMKKIAELSNSYDYSILFTEQNLIQMSKHVDLEQQIEIIHKDQKYGSSRKQRSQWLDLLELYHKMNQTDNLFAILDKTVTSQIKKQLTLALKFKSIGDLVSSGQQFYKLKDIPEIDPRIKELILGQYLQCETLLGNWEKVRHQLFQKSQRSTLTKNECRILTTATLSVQDYSSSESLKVIDFKKHHLFYQEAILSLSLKGITDTPKYLLKSQTNQFVQAWNRISAFALRSKHELIQNLQKTHQFSEFLDLFDKVGITLASCKQMFSNWTDRAPSAIYDSHITSLQILQGRKKYSKLMAERFSMSDTVIVKNTIDWLVQQADIMVKKGSFGSAQHLIKTALLSKRSVANFFSWGIYKATGKLKLKQLMMQANTTGDQGVLANFQQLPSLIVKQMNNARNVSAQIFMQLDLLKVKYYEAFLQLYQQRVSQPQCPTTLVKQYVEGIQKTFKILIDCFRNELINAPELTSDIFKIKRKVYMGLTCFCQKIFGMLEGSNRIQKLVKPLIDINLTLQTMTKLFGGGLIKSLNLIGFGQQRDGQIKKSDYKICFLILKFLKVIQRRSDTMGQLFVDMVHSRKVPMWIFLHFIPQIVSSLSMPTSKYFEDFFMLIAEQYPQALIYQFNSQFEDRSHCITPESIRIYDFLHQKYPWHYVFIQALDSLNHPQLRLSDALGMCFDKVTVNDGIRQLKLLIDVDDQYKGQYTRKFARDWTKDIKKFIEGIERRVNVTDIKKSIIAKLQALPNISQGYNKLSNFSLFFQSYASSDIQRFSLMTQPYRLAEQPLKQMKIYIQSFDQTILTLGSLRKPKRLTMFGNNQKKYNVLVKGGQDLRLDQRIQQIFSVMNVILLKDVQCQNREQFIRRYEVIPIKKTVGLVEWVDNTQALRSFLQKQQIQIKNDPALDLFTKNQAYKERLKFLQTLSKQKSNLQMHLPLLFAEDHKIIFNQNKMQSMIPYGLLRRGIQKLAISYDSFLHLKNRFISNYAVSCVACYILGIGDRHLDNFLIHIPSATIVLIDFGRSFDYVVDLKMPQLMPFRMTKSFRQLTEPIGVYGSFKVNLVHALKAFRTQHEQIIDFAEVFINDPVLDWIKISRKKQSKIAITSSEPNFSQSQEVSKQQRDFFAMKIQTVRRKLQGYHPRLILANLLKDTIHKNGNYLPNLLKVVLKDKKINSHYILSLDQQAQQLIQMSIDPNINGRVYTGWQPWA